MNSQDVTPQGPRTTVLLIDDHSLVAETLQIAFGLEGKLDFLTAQTIEEGVELIGRHGRFDVVLLDFDMPGLSGLEGLQIMLQANRGNVALFTGVAGRAAIERAIAAGASGLIPKTIPLKILKHAINFIADGEVFVPARFSHGYENEPGEDLGFKKREIQVLGLLGEGHPNKEICRILDLPESTVKSDVKAICRKFGVQNRTQAILEAKRRGVL